MQINYTPEHEHILDELKARGYYEDSTNEEKLRELLKTPQHFYIGFDATADSLTIGHFIQLMVMMRMQAYGHTPIALLGAGTTMIGDPSGRSDMRSVMTKERIDSNAQRFANQMNRFLNFDEDKAILANNADWLLPLNFLSFMREVGVHFSVNEMIKKDAYRTRMEAGGLTFFEFSYMLLQSYDFLELYRRYGCKIEFGGSDQWANIIGGVELIRRKEQEEVCAMTFKLLTTADGVKMGKSMKGAIWLDEEKTSPYELFQYMRNCDDRDVKKYLLLLTFLPTARCEELGSYQDAKINEAKEVLAYEVTKLIHGEEKAKKALDTSRSLFSQGENHADMPQCTLSVDEPMGILALLTQSGLTKSNGEARRLVQQGGIRIDDEKVNDASLELSVERLKAGITIKKGKKTYLRVIAE